jgi:EC042_2821-lke REase
VRLTDDPAAPVVRALDPDRTHPFRQTEVLTRVNKLLPVARREVTGYDVQCVRKVYDIDGKAEYSHKPLFASRQYSQAFIDWMAEAAKKDKAFFAKARRKAKG